MKDYIELEIAEIKNEAPDTKSFVLRSTNGVALDYQPGQFLTLVFPGHLNEERRSYSISSSPAKQEPLTITVKRIDNGTFSRYLFDVCTVGSRLYTIGVAGFFTIPKEMHTWRKFVFFAAGSGITPVISLIKTILAGHRDVTIRLIYSNRSPADAIFLNELERIRAENAERFSVTYFFSTAKDLLRARLNKTTVAEVVKEESSPREHNTLFYLCGPHSYMQMVSITLLTEGVPPPNIRKEIFDTQKPIVKERPSDTMEHAVRLHYRGVTSEFTVQYPETILATAKRNGIFLPYSCEAGKCGTCAATCIEGRVWMSYNEVLLDKELRDGRILTCTGYPVGGDVTLSFDL